MVGGRSEYEKYFRVRRKLIEFDMRGTSALQKARKAIM